MQNDDTLHNYIPCSAVYGIYGSPPQLVEEISAPPVVAKPNPLLRQHTQAAAAEPCLVTPVESITPPSEAWQHQLHIVTQLKPYNALAGAHQPQSRCRSCTGSQLPKPALSWHMQRQLQAGTCSRCIAAHFTLFTSVVSRSASKPSTASPACRQPSLSRSHGGPAAHSHIAFLALSQPAGSGMSLHPSVVYVCRPTRGTLAPSSGTTPHTTGLSSQHTNKTAVSDQRQALILIHYEITDRLKSLCYSGRRSQLASQRVQPPCAFNYSSTASSRGLQPRQAHIVPTTQTCMLLSSLIAQAPVQCSARPSKAIHANMAPAQAGRRCHPAAVAHTQQNSHTDRAHNQGASTHTPVSCLRHCRDAAAGEHHAASHAAAVGLTIAHPPKLTTLSQHADNALPSSLRWQHRHWSW